MNKLQLVESLDGERKRRRISKGMLANTAGLSLRTVDKALTLGGNPTLSNWLTLVDLVGLEVQLVPKGFGPPAEASDGTSLVPTVVSKALG